MFIDRQKFQMGESEVFGIGRQNIRQFTVGEPLVVFLASPSASYITGITLHANGGMYMA